MAMNFSNQAIERTMVTARGGHLVAVGAYHATTLGWNVSVIYPCLYYALVLASFVPAVFLPGTTRQRFANVCYFLGGSIAIGMVITGCYFFLVICSSFWMGRQ